MTSQFDKVFKMLQPRIWRHCKDGVTLIKSINKEHFEYECETCKRQDFFKSPDIVVRHMGQAEMYNPLEYEKFEPDKAVAFGDIDF